MSAFSRCRVKGCNQTRLHGGNKKLAAKHSKIMKQMALNGELESAPMSFTDMTFTKATFKTRLTSTGTRVDI